MATDTSLDLITRYVSARDADESGPSSEFSVATPANAQRFFLPVGSGESSTDDTTQENIIINAAAVPSSGTDINCAEPVSKDVKIDLTIVTDGKPADSNPDTEKKAEPPMVKYLELYKFADAWDYFLITLGVLCSLAHGAVTPLFSVLFGKILDGFDINNSDKLVSNVADACQWMAILGAISFAVSYGQVACFVMTSQRQGKVIRYKYFRALLCQEMGWYDSQTTGALTSRISEDVTKIQEALGDKVGSFLQFHSMFFTGFIIGFIYGWKLAFVILSVAPLLGFCGYLMSKALSDASSKGSSLYASAGGVIDEILALIRTVFAFGAEKYEEQRYTKFLTLGRAANTEGGKSLGLGMGVTMGILFGVYALAFYYGSKLIRDGEISPGQVMTVFFAIVMGAMGIGQAAPSLAAFSAGRGAAVTVYDILNRKSAIDALSEQGKKMDSSALVGKIEFRNVSFSYPTRPKDAVLKNCSLVIEPNTTVALVGESGCGKSTIVALLERFYDPDGVEHSAEPRNNASEPSLTEAAVSTPANSNSTVPNSPSTDSGIFLDGHRLNDLNIQWLRSQIAYVSQQPVLFPGTIFSNIAHGKNDATKEEVERAAKLANAYNFIEAFPAKFDTQVGDLGGQLSGGQKQRIAIARALIKNPRILLLDEATSALDSTSEKVVQKALDEASKGRTTVIIAHRLSTIRDATKIVVLDNGCLLEQGTHDELMQAHGRYAGMVELQRSRQSDHQDTLEDLPPPPTTAEVTPLPIGPKASTSVQIPDSDNDALVTVQTPVDLAKKDTPDEEKGTPDVANDSEIALAKGVSMFKWAWQLSRPEWSYIVVALLMATFEGGMWPAFSILLSECLAVMLSGNNEALMTRYVLGFVGLGVGVFLVIFVKYYFMAIANECLTLRLRVKTVHAFLHQSCSWFDDTKHSKGVLATRLATDADLVKGMLGQRLSLMMVICGTMGGGIAIAMIYCWQVGLVVLACFPVVAGAGALQLKLMTGYSQAKEYEKSSKFASEAVENIRTVLSLGRVSSFLDHYDFELSIPARKAIRVSFVQGVMFGVSEFCLFGIWALAFWFGSHMVQDNKCNFGEMMKAFSAVVFGAMMSGQMSSMAPDVAKATEAAQKIYTIIKEQELYIQANPPGTAKPDFQGKLEFKNIEFAYPARPHAQILRGLNLTVNPGETVALVGSSGCGKTTLMSLLQGFYKPAKGALLIDGVDASTIEPSYLRSKIGFVTQEPQLFSTTITDNITYGIWTDVPQEKVEKASSEANAHNFITEFKDSYQTVVGERGQKVSGGQRQRIAIARALIRQNDIKFLLLDEATSALDTESEKIVHTSLDRARKGRTTLIIAHRLSTVQNADRIVVIHEGVVVEQGTHETLLEARSHYFNLVESQR